MKSNHKRDETLSSFSEEIRWLYTAFVERVIRNARIDYLRYVRRLTNVEQLVRDIPGGIMVDAYKKLTDHVALESFVKPDTVELAFEEERLVRIIHDLPLLKKRLLYYYFVEGLSAAEVAAKLNCPVRWVYLTRSRLITHFRAALEGEGKDEPRLQPDIDKGHDG